MSSLLKRPEIPRLLLSIIIISLCVDYFIDFPIINIFSSIVQDWIIVLAAFALLLGLTGTLIYHANHINKRTKEQWYMSIWTIVLIAIMILIGTLYSTEHSIYKWIYDYMYQPLGTTVYTMLGFFIFSAAYRAFRARNIDAGILLTCAILVMLRNVPIGQAIWAGFPVIGDWILSVPQLSGNRVIYLVLAVGMFTLGMRILLWYERPLERRGET